MCHQSLYGRQTKWLQVEQTASLLNTTYSSPSLKNRSVTVIKSRPGMQIGQFRKLYGAILKLHGHSFVQKGLQIKLQAFL
jgi:hypothetical protein